MAVLGVPLVISMIMATIMSKVMPRYSLAQSILCNRLARYVQPNQEELCAAAHMPPKPNRKGRGRRDSGSSEEVTIPKSTPITLDIAQVRFVDLVQLHFYSDFQWLVDFTACSLIVYVISELYVGLVQPKNEFNLSLVWCLVALLFAVRILYSVTAIYFRTEGGERHICVFFAFAFLILSMGIIITDEQSMDFGLKDAYANFSAGAVQVLQSQGFESSGPISFLTFQIILVIFSAIIGSFLAFPGMRLAKMHTDAMKFSRGNRSLQTLLYINMLFPLLLSLLWVRPIVKNIVGRNTAMGRFSVEAFCTLRICSMLAFCCLRLSLIWPHLQAHLNLADRRVQELRREAGRVAVRDVQLMVTRIFQYLCVVALQYVAPVLLLAQCVFLFKTLGNHSWGELTHPFNTTASLTPSVAMPTVANDTESVAATAGESVYAQTTSGLVVTLGAIFTPTFFRGLLSYVCWWICTASFCTSVFGLIYYNYFPS